jgi:hypothetical protein
VRTNDVRPADDQSIADDAILWRRIHPNHFIHDENRGGLRPSSAAFANHKSRQVMSVILADVSLRCDRGPNEVLALYSGYALAAITAGTARECQQAVVPEPLPDEPGHAVVAGEKTKAVMRRLAAAAVWIIAPSTAAPG